MKKIIIATLLCCTLIAPQASAQTTDRSALLAQIQQLLEILAALQAKAGQQTINEIRYIVPAAAVPTTEARLLSSFPRVDDTWADNFIVGAVPSNAYKAFYIDTNNPNTVIHSEIIPKVAVSYSWSDGGDFTITSENFGGYWVGDIDIPTDGNYVVSTAESWSESRVIIDDRLVKQNDSEEVLYLEAGTYRVEVEYVNNWHTTDFSMSILPQTKEYTKAEVITALRTVDDAENWYAGVYESDSFDRTLDLDVTAMNDDSILFLASYSQLEWVLSANTNLKAIVLTSYESGTSVTGVDSSVPVYRLGYRDLASEYRIGANCSSYRANSIQHCDNLNQLNKIDKDVRSLTGTPIDTFTGSYSSSNLIAPGEVITDSVREEYQDSYQKIIDDAAEETRGIDDIF